MNMMNYETIKTRIENANAKIAKKRSTIDKKNALIAKKLSKRDKEFDENEKFWIEIEVKHLMEDVERNHKEIEGILESIKKLEAQLDGANEEERILSEVPESMKRMQDELVANWDEFDKERRTRIRKDHNELEYKAFWKKYNRSDYDFMYWTDEQIHNSNVKDARSLVLNLYYRVRDITGEITDWSGIEATIGTWGMTVLNGVVIGKEGKAAVESIFAGGYNIQRLHVRVLVKEFK